MNRSFRVLLSVGWVCMLSYFEARCQGVGLFKDLTPVGYERVEINDNFWRPRMDKVSTVALQACIDYTEYKTPRIRNFERAAAKTGKHQGIYFDDSDVYKALEAMAYSLRYHPDSSLEHKADEWISKIAAAQMPDGYVNTYFQLRDLSQRWTDIEKHEDYCAGHLIEAAIAYFNTTHKRTLLDVAIRLANHIDSTFRLSGTHWVSGHEEIELALMKLYQLTGTERYRQLAAWYIDQRGHGYGHSPVWSDPKSHEYYQDDVPVKEASKIKGHAVRAMYLYSGVADVAKSFKDSTYYNAMERIWKDVVYRNMYVTGGIGSSGDNEGFTRDYDLPNAEAYCETCASVGMVLWNYRMNLLTGESKYIDVLERSLYNAALDGLSLSGNRFFYGNPLASIGQYARSEWFGTACCPSNIARLVASLGNYIYATSPNGIWVNLFVGNSAQLQGSGRDVQITQTTNYPWDGDIQIKVKPTKAQHWKMHIRVPGWAQGKPVPGDLYEYQVEDMDSVGIWVNGRKVSYQMENGYAVIERRWQRQDSILIHFPMHAMLVRANEKVLADRNRVAIQRGPLVYCVESAGNPGNAWNILMPAQTVFEEKFDPDLLGGVEILRAELPVLTTDSDGQSVSVLKQKVIAIPYFTWCNRKADGMQVWLPVKIQDLKINY